MKTNKWLNLKVVENIENTELKLGDEFLFGSSVISQRETKKVKNKIVYYRVIGVNNGNIQYAPIEDILEEV